MNGKKIIIGVAPVKRDFLSMAEAKKNKEVIMKRIKEIYPEDIEIVNIDDVVEDGVMWNRQHVSKVVNKFNSIGVQGLFIPHCDFGTEEVAVSVAKSMNIPLLIWGPRDENPDKNGVRIADTQCGILATSKVLMNNNVPFSYIINSHVDSEQFINGFKRFAETVSVVTSFRHMRIAQLGTRPQPFLSVMCNETEMLNKFGIEIVPISIADIFTEINELIKGDAKELEAIISDFKERVECKVDEDYAKKMAALKSVLHKKVTDLNCNALAFECWSLFPKLLGILPCFVAAEISDLGIPVACETDVKGAVASVMLQAAAFNRAATFFADFTIRNHDDDNTELLWHCGPFPYSLKDKNSTAQIIDGKAQWKLKNGDITLARFDEIGGNYNLLSGEGKGVDGPYTDGTYTWFEADVWEKWEEKIIFGPYIHHVSGIYGNYSRVLTEACKFIPGLNADPVGPHTESL